MEIAYIINIAGLILDILGVIILYAYGLPSKYKEDSESLVLEESSESKMEREGKNKKIKKWAITGLCFLISGFVFQLFATLINVFKS